MHGQLERLTARLNSHQLKKRRQKIEDRPVSAFTFNRVLTALEEPGILWKTPTAIAQETGLAAYTTEAIIDTLAAERDELLRSSHLDYETGEPCYTTRRHLTNTAPLYIHLKRIFAGGVD